MGRTASGHVHTRTRLHVYECALGGIGHTAHPRYVGRVEAANPRALTGSAPLSVNDVGTSNRCSRAATAHPADRRQEGAGYPAVPRVTTHDMPQLALAHTRSQMFRYRCVTVGEIPARKNPCVPMKHWAAGGFLWRYRWDLNPRWSLPHTTFRELHLRPLGHGTEGEFS